MQERPEIHPGDQLVFEAFCFLSPSRPSGFTLGAIPLAEILAFTQFHPLGMPVHEFVRIIRIVDLAVLTDHHAHGSKQNTSSQD